MICVILLCVRPSSFIATILISEKIGRVLALFGRIVSFLLQQYNIKNRALGLKKLLS